MIAVDGTKVPGNASRNANADYEQIACAILEEAQAVDAAEDDLYGDARGDELPEQLRTGEGFRRRGRAAVRAEWRLITATHKLLKLHRHALTAA